ncbi:MAG TPA: response regulator, partial [Ktedonobacteraceae bacterium]
HLISERKPDLLLLDDLLPGMHGLELYDYLHTIPALSTVPALLISANNHRSKEVERHHLTFLAKPYELETLLETIHALLERE